jgi:hypothetical protein
MIANAGHAPFWDDATAFNQGLREFAAAVSSRIASVEHIV